MSVLSGGQCWGTKAGVRGKLELPEEGWLGLIRKVTSGHYKEMTEVGI